jgi:hypothetical protein
MTPIQNNGTSAERIARVGLRLLDSANSRIEIDDIKQLKSALL